MSNTHPPSLPRENRFGIPDGWERPGITVLVARDHTQSNAWKRANNYRQFTPEIKAIHSLDDVYMHLVGPKRKSYDEVIFLHLPGPEVIDAMYDWDWIGPDTIYELDY